MSLLKCLAAISVSCVPISVYISDKFKPWINSFTIHAQPRDRPRPGDRHYDRPPQQLWTRSYKRKHQTVPIRCPRDTFPWVNDRLERAVPPEDAGGIPYSGHCTIIPTHKTPELFPKPESDPRIILEYDEFIMCYDKSKCSPCWTVELLWPKNLKKLPDNYEIRREDRLLLRFSTHDMDYRDTSAEADDAEQRFKKMFLVEPSHHRIDKAFNALVYTNVVPEERGQHGSLWDDLNSYIEFLIPLHDNVYVCSGPLYIPTSKTLTEDGTREMHTAYIGRKKIPVPTHFFRVIACEKKDKTFHLECYRIKNAPIRGSEELKDYQVARKSIEREAGFRIFEHIKPEMVTSKNILPNFVEPRKRRRRVRTEHPPTLPKKPQPPPAGPKKPDQVPAVPKEPPPTGELEKTPTKESPLRTLGIVLSPVPPMLSPLSPGELERSPIKEPSPKRRRVEYSPVAGPSSQPDFVYLQPRVGEVEEFIAAELSAAADATSRHSTVPPPASVSTERKGERSAGREYLVPRRSSSTTMKTVSAHKSCAQQECPTRTPVQSITLKRIEGTKKYAVVPRTVSKPPTTQELDIPETVTYNIYSPAQPGSSPAHICPTPISSVVISSAPVCSATEKGTHAGLPTPIQEYHPTPIAAATEKSQHAGLPTPHGITQQHDLSETVTYKICVPSHPGSAPPTKSAVPLVEEYQPLLVSSVVISSKEYHPAPVCSATDKSQHAGLPTPIQEYHPTPIASATEKSQHAGPPTPHGITEQHETVTYKICVPSKPGSATPTKSPIPLVEEYHPLPISSAVISSEEYCPTPIGSPTESMDICVPAEDLFERTGSCHHEEKPLGHISTLPEVCDKQSTSSTGHTDPEDIIGYVSASSDSSCGNIESEKRIAKDVFGDVSFSSSSSSDSKSPTGMEC